MVFLVFSNTSFQTTDYIPIAQYRLEINMEEGDTQPSKEGRPKDRNKTVLNEAEVISSPRRTGSALEHMGESSETSTKVSGSSLVPNPAQIPGPVRSHK